MAGFKLIVDSVKDYGEYTYLTEEANNKTTPNLYIIGPYMAANEVNRNKRIYNSEEMNNEVNRFIAEKVQNGSSVGELNHPPNADINLERACHLITELKRENDVWVGKSKVLSGPCGNVVRSLINDQVRFGMSTRCLGKVRQTPDNIGQVYDMRLITVDCVADPSYSKAFVNGILESKTYNIDFTECEEAYDEFEDSMKTLPVKNRNEYYIKRISEFLNKITNS